MTTVSARALKSADSTTGEPCVRHLGCVAYDPTWRAMRDFTARRNSDTPDEIWLLEHPPVYTLGIAGKADHLPRIDNGIPVVKTDRGGQITYHGPGQVVMYVLLDMRRLGLTVRPLVRRLEGAVIDFLADYGVGARGSVDAPGVYVGDAKIAALGLRIRNGRCYHGIAFNLDIDLMPFHAINPCGYPGLQVTRACDLGIRETPKLAGEKIARHFLHGLR